MRRRVSALLGTLFLLLLNLNVPGCGSSDNALPPMEELKDTRTEEQKNDDDSMAKHFQKYGNR